MTTTRQNLELWAGDHKKLVFIFEHPINLAEGVDTVKWAMSASNKSNPVVEKSSDNGSSEVEVKKDRFIVKLVPGDSENLDPGVYYHEAELTDGDGNISTVAVGEIRLRSTII